MGNNIFTKLTITNKHDNFFNEKNCNLRVGSKSGIIKITYEFKEIAAIKNKETT